MVRNFSELMANNVLHYCQCNNVLLKFINVFLTAIGNCYSNNSVKAIAEFLPRSLFAFQKCVNIEQVICGMSFLLFTLQAWRMLSREWIWKEYSKKCSFVVFPNHSQPNKRLPCKSSLLVKVNLSNEKTDYRPKYVYAYHPIKHSLQRLLKIPSISEKLDQWRNRQTVINTLSDVLMVKYGRIFFQNNITFFYKQNDVLVLC